MEAAPASHHGTDTRRQSRDGSGLAECQNHTMVLSTIHVAIPWDTLSLYYTLYVVKMLDAFHIPGQIVADS